jgi:hypothetical protein
LNEQDLDRAPDIYDSFAGAEVVVAEVSTALYEAIGLVPRIYAWDTPKSRFHLGEHPFKRLTDPDALRQPWHEDDPIVVADEIWASDWDRRFRSFVDT